MRRMYQDTWHRIPFRSFATLSSTRLAGADFYAAFYRAFFARYAGPEQLEPQWLTVKRQSADFLRSRPEITKDSRILSLGCGIGFIEQLLIADGYRHIEINEVSKDPLRWILPSIDEDRVHVGFFPQCVPADRTYDAIILGGIDGVFDRDGWVSLLKSVRERLRPGGHCIILSWSHHAGRSTLQAVVDTAKDAVKAVLDRTGIRSRGQLWGFLRSPEELRSAVEAAGLELTEDGVLEKTTVYPPYWMVARRP